MPDTSMEERLKRLMAILKRDTAFTGMDVKGQRSKFEEKALQIGWLAEDVPGLRPAVTEAQTSHIYGPHHSCTNARGGSTNGAIRPNPSCALSGPG